MCLTLAVLWIIVSSPVANSEFPTLNERASTVMFNSVFWQSVADLPTLTLVFLVMSLVVAFGFEFINGFHDTANAVTTVIYTHSLKPMPAVIFSGFCNFLGVLLGGTAVAFSIVNLLPVDVLVDESSGKALVMVISLLLAGVI